MKINVKLLCIFLFVALLIGFVGYVGINSIKSIQENNNIESDVREFALLLDHSLLLTLQLTKIENQDDFNNMKASIENARKEMDVLNSKNKETRVHLQYLDSFDTNVNNYIIISNGIINIHNEKLVLKKSYDEKFNLENNLWSYQINVPLNALNNRELTDLFASTEVFRSKALFQYKDQEHITQWLYSIQEIKNEINHLNLPQDQKNNLLQDIDSYKFTAQRLGEIIIEQKNVEKVESQKFILLKKIIENIQENEYQLIKKIHAENSSLAENTATILLIVMVFTFLTAISLGLFIDRSISKPIINLKEATDKIAKGNFDTMINIRSQDEIGELGIAFNRMSHDLKNHSEGRNKAEEALRESEERYRTIIEHSNDIIWTLDLDGNILFFNRRVEESTGHNLETWVGKSFTSMLHEENIPGITEIFREILSGQPRQYEVTIRSEKGSDLNLWVNSAPIYSKGEIVGMVNFGRDITERKKIEEQIIASLKEKEVLLREIHHRVKNNMQIVSSLLWLQSEYIMDKKYREMFKDSQNRIMSMSLVHEKLYRSNDLAKIGSTEYITALAHNLFESYEVKGAVALDINVENISLGIDSAIPCGLIINELITNSLKHAFPNGRRGEIKVSLHLADEDMAELTVGDNGIGIPDSVDFRKTESLGLRLITMLAEDQLQGGVSLDGSKGTEFRIKFKGRK